MALDPDVVRRLVALGYDTPASRRTWEQMAADHDHEFVRGYLREEEHAAATYREWMPRLRAFADRCRVIDPIPDPATFTPAEAAQAQVLRAKMLQTLASEDAVVLAGRPNKAVVVSVSAVGLPAAAALLAGPNRVLLLPDEDEAWWGRLYQPVRPPMFWWWVQCWWTVKPGLGGWDEPMLRNIPRQHPLPPGGEYWQVECGSLCASMSGGSRTELWVWDGTHARYATDLCDMTC